MHDGPITIPPHLPRAFHFMSWPLVPSLVHLTALIDFLNVESSDLFCVHFDVWHMHTLCETISTIKRENIIYHPQKFPSASLKSIPPGSSLPTPSSRQPPVCFLSLLISLHSLEFYMYSCFVWLLSLRIMISRFICGVVCIDGLFPGIFLEFLW